MQQAIYFDTPDGRMVFAIPRDGKTYVGTTDTVYKGDIAHPTMTESDRDYVINAIQFMFPNLDISSQDVESSWAGLRPLIYEEGKDPSEISRKDEIFESSSGLISIAGGKLTGYRKMAEDVVKVIVDKMIEKEKRVFKPSNTKHLPISGGDVGGSKGFVAYAKEQVKDGMKIGLTKEETKLLILRYGSNVPKLFDYYKKALEDDSDIHPVTKAMLLYSIEHELTCKPVDFFIRRTGALFFDINWVQQEKDAVTDEMQHIFKWTDEQKDVYTKELENLLYEAVHPTNE